MEKNEKTIFDVEILIESHYRILTKFKRLKILIDRCGKV